MFKIASWNINSLRVRLRNSDEHEEADEPFTLDSLAGGLATLRE